MDYKISVLSVKDVKNNNNLSYKYFVVQYRVGIKQSRVKGKWERLHILQH